MSKIMNDDNEWDQIHSADTEEGPIETGMREDIIVVFKDLKIEKATGSSEVYAEMILTSRDVGIRALMELC